MIQLKVGDTFWLELEPFEVEVIVVGIVPAGAELQYTGRTKLVGYIGRMVAQDGTLLTTDPMHGFLGRAHWGSIEAVEPGQDPDSKT